MQRALLQHAAALLVKGGHAQRQASFGTSENVLQVDLDPGVMILAAKIGWRATLRAPRRAAEQRLEEVAPVVEAEVLGATIAAAVELEARSPARRRLEVGARVGSALADRIVGGALLVVLQNLVGLAHFLEAGLGIGLLADVGMDLRASLRNARLMSSPDASRATPSVE